MPAMSSRRTKLGTRGSERRTRVNASAGRRAALILGCAALVLAGCTTTKKGNSGVEGGQPAPGVTADEAKIGFIFTDLGKISEQLGLKVDPAGDPNQQVQILTEWVNKNGGLGGRKMVPDLVKFQASTDAPSVEESLCNQFTQDDKVFAVVLTGQFQENARPCYQRKRTIAVDETTFPLDNQAYDDLSPYLWAPGLVSYDDYVDPFIKALETQGFFKGGKVGVLAPDTPVNHRVVEGKGFAALAAAGVSSPITQWIDVKTTESLNGGLGNAAQKFIDAKVDRVVFFGGQRLAPFFAVAGNAFNYSPMYGISSIDNPKSILDNQALTGGNNPLKSGAMGISFQPVNDVADAQYPFPATFGESQCQTIFAQGGLTFKNRSEAAQPFHYCDAVLFIKGAMDKAKLDGAPGALSPEDFGKAASTMATNFQAARSISTNFAGSHAGAATFRLMAYDPSCVCFQLKGENVAFKAG